MSASTALIQVFGRPDCPDTQRVRDLLGGAAVDYAWHDVTERPELQDEAMALNGGINKVPTVTFPNGAVLVEPSDDEVRVNLPE